MVKFPALKPQEISLDDPESNNMFLPGPVERTPFVNQLRKDIRGAIAAGIAHFVGAGGAIGFLAEIDKE